jgi:prolyl oligopeptidase
VDPSKPYCRLFLTTSTKDDRVHPYHARIMAKAMEAAGKPFLYYENTQGGHAGSGDILDKARTEAMIYTYFMRELGL